MSTAFLPQKQKFNTLLKNVVCALAGAYYIFEQADFSEINHRRLLCGL